MFGDSIDEEMIKNALQVGGVLPPEMFLGCPQENICFFINFVAQHQVAHGKDTVVQISHPQKSIGELPAFIYVSQRKVDTFVGHEFQSAVSVTVLAVVEEPEPPVYFLDFVGARHSSVKVEVLPPQFTVSIVEVQFDVV